ncbi:MAG: hypothetical protein OJJ54_03515 [Pseudonocardia sp.]|nr:hypothetical protein [Pseudonocardia sp.]
MVVEEGEQAGPVGAARLAQVPADRLVDPHEGVPVPGAEVATDLGELGGRAALLQPLDEELRLAGLHELLHGR